MIYEKCLPVVNVPTLSDKINVFGPINNLMVLYTNQIIFYGNTLIFEKNKKYILSTY
jgi:hypothetical protein